MERVWWGTPSSVRSSCTGCCWECFRSRVGGNDAMDGFLSGGGGAGGPRAVRHAIEGSGGNRRRARQPAHRLRAGGGAGRKRGHAADLVLAAEPGQHAGTHGRLGSGSHPSHQGPGRSIGYGLGVGLAGKGDTQQTLFSPQSLANMLERMGVSVPGATLRTKDMAAVMITATLPPFAQPGIHLDVTAAAIGDATNLQGGVLLLAPLKAADGQVYAAAQGAVVTGGFSAGRGGASQTVNHPTVGRGINLAV